MPAAWGLLRRPPSPSASPPVDDERAPLAGEREGSGIATTSYRRLTQALRRAGAVLGPSEDGGGTDGRNREAASAAMRAIGVFRDQVEARINENGTEAPTGNVTDGDSINPPSPGGGTVGTGGGADVGGGTSDVPQGDIQAFARWVEDSMPFVMLLLAVFLYRHMLGIVTFGWLTSILHNANERMRRQTLLKENRSRPALLVLFFVLVGHIGFIAAVQGWDRMTQPPAASQA